MKTTTKNNLQNRLLGFVCTLLASILVAFHYLPTQGKAGTQANTKVESALEWLAIYKYPHYVSAAESFNEELGKMKEGPVNIVNEQEYKDGFIVFDRQIVTLLKKTGVFVFKSCFYGPCGNESPTGNHIVFSSPDTTFGLQSFYEMRDTTWQYVSRIEILIELLNQLFQLEEPEEFAADELLELITTVFTLEPSWVTILHNEDDVIMPSRGREQGILTDKELKELEERHIVQEKIRYAREGNFLEILKEFGIKGPLVTMSQEGLYFTLYVKLPRLGAYRVVLRYIDGVFFLTEKTASGLFPSSEIN